MNTDEGKEYARYVAAHRMKVMVVDLEDGGARALAVMVPLTCEHLEYDGNTGLCSCAIYEARPKICRDHLCNAAKED
jgi:Fe-S-cluster containining protein